MPARRFRAFFGRRFRIGRPRRLPDGGGLVFAAVFLLAFLAWAFSLGVPGRSRRGARVPAPSAPGSASVAIPPGRDVTICAWNVENLFDDRDDPSNPDADENWFGNSPSAVDEKVGLLAEALLTQNAGRGPDVLVLLEVESRRALEFLRQSLNAALPAGSQYGGLVFRPLSSGRRIAPGVLTRLAVDESLTRDDSPRRTLEAHLVGPAGAPLVVIATHWTSRLNAGSDVRRAAYADAIAARVDAILAADPTADVVIAGDFNDGPTDPSVRDHLCGPRRAGPPLVDLTTALNPATDGTYRYRGRWEVLDHIVVSPGLFDGAGWSVRADSLRVENGPARRVGRDRRPWGFGGPKRSGPRGASDHFAVTARLTVAP